MKPLFKMTIMKTGQYAHEIYKKRHTTSTVHVSHGENKLKHPQKKHTNAHTGCKER